MGDPSEHNYGVVAIQGIDKLKGHSQNAVISWVVLLSP